MEPCKPLSANPDQSSGAYSRVFDTATGYGTSSVDLYEVPCGRRLRAEASRKWGPLPMRPPIEVLTDELAADPAIVEEFNAAVAGKEFPPCYWEHPGVIETPDGEELPLPFALYLDAVQYTRRDSVLAFWVYWLLTGARHCIFVVRKHEMCSCGCRGWCTLYPVFAALAWSFAALLEGRHPLKRHDGSEWQASDVGRASCAGEKCRRAVCLFIKGDWAELVQRWGFAAWNDQMFPCPFCDCTVDTMFRLQGFSPLGMPFPEASLEKYEEACRRCERWRVLTDADVRRVRPLLVFESKDKARGRCLREAVPELGLEKNDRLEPTLEFPDIGELSSGRPTLWWRSSLDGPARRRNPLLCKKAGASMRTFVVDWMHSLSLGVFPHLLGFLLC